MKCPFCGNAITLGNGCHCKVGSEREALGPSDATACSVVLCGPNLVQAGDLWLVEDESAYHPDKMEYSLLIQCANAEQVREAMKTGKIEFTVFAHYPQNVQSEPTASQDGSKNAPTAPEPLGSMSCCASSLSYATLEIAGMDHPKKGNLVVIDKATNEPLPEKYAIQYADSNLGYFVYLDRDTHDPKLVINRKLEIRCPKEE